MNKFNIGDIVSIECVSGSRKGTVIGFDDGDYFVKEMSGEYTGLWDDVPWSWWDLTLVTAADTAEYTI